MEITTSSEEQTQELAKSFAKTLKPGDIVALYGELGAGKSVFVRGVARGFGIKDRISSPTFTFIKSYQKGKITLHHIDLYRGESIKDFESLALDEVFTQGAIVMVEWANRIEKFLPKKRIDVKLEANDGQRTITITRN